MKSKVSLLPVAVNRTGLEDSSHSCFQGWLAHGQDLCDPKPDGWVTGLACRKFGFKFLLCPKQTWYFSCQTVLQSGWFEFRTPHAKRGTTTIRVWSICLEMEAFPLKP